MASWITAQQLSSRLFIVQTLECIRMRKFMYNILYCIICCIDYVQICFVDSLILRYIVTLDYVSSHTIYLIHMYVCKIQRSVTYV